MQPRASSNTVLKLAIIGCVFREHERTRNILELVVGAYLYTWTKKRYEWMMIWYHAKSGDKRANEAEEQK